MALGLAVVTPLRHRAHAALRGQVVGELAAVVAPHLLELLLGPGAAVGPHALAPARAPDLDGLESLVRPHGAKFNLFVVAQRSKAAHIDDGLQNI